MILKNRRGIGEGSIYFRTLARSNGHLHSQAQWSLRRERLQDDPLVADAASDSLAVEVLQQRYGVLPGDAE
jgi:hypothetical protein